MTRRLALERACNNAGLLASVDDTDADLEAYLASQNPGHVFSVPQFDDLWDVHPDHQVCLEMAGAVVARW